MPWDTTVDKLKRARTASWATSRRLPSHFCLCLDMKILDKQKGWMFHSRQCRMRSWPDEKVCFSSLSYQYLCYVWQGYGGSYFERVKFMQEQEQTENEHAYCDWAATTASSWEVASGNFQRSSFHVPMDEHLLFFSRCDLWLVKSMPPSKIMCCDMLRSGEWHCSLRVPWLDSLSSTIDSFGFGLPSLCTVPKKLRCWVGEGGIAVAKQRQILARLGGGWERSLTTTMHI